MQDLIRPDASFTPRELFARMQGAWFEPRIGSMWQENTGVTPTTTGGQTIGLMLDQSQGAVLGPELVTNGTFDTDINGIQEVRDSTNIIITTTNTWDNGVLKSARDGANNFGFSVPVSVTAGCTYSIKATAIQGTAARVFVRFSPTKKFSDAVAYTNTTTGTFGTTNLTFNAIATTTSTWYVLLQCVDITSGSVYHYFDNISVREILGNHGSNSTAANRPTYQLDSNNLPLARHDTTDSLSVSLPAINVRRNLLTNSQQIQSSPWGLRTGTVVATGNYALAPDGTATATLLSKTVAADSRWSYGYSFAASTTYTASIYFKKTAVNAVSELALRLYLTGGVTDCYAIIDTLTGATALRGSTGTVSSVSVGDYWRIIVTKATATGTVLDAGVVIAPYLGTNIASPNFGLTGSCICWGAQLELGSVATDYKKITDWTSEAYSSSGSTYFATPTGMSCLHNQSIGTTYNLPAPQTDNYCTVITPARLAPPLEQRLALYMHRLAGLSDADFFWQEQATDGMTGQLLADDNDTILLRA